MNRSALFAGVLLTFAISGMGLLLGTSGVIGFGSGSRTAAEQREVLSDGDCAVRPDGAVVGRVIGQLPPTRGNPRKRYVVETTVQRQVLQVYTAEVRVLPCATLQQ